MAAVHGQRGVAGICHHLGSLLRGADGACLLRIAGMPAGWAGCRQLSCPRPHTAVARRRWWHGRMWPASPPAGGFAMGRVPGQGRGAQDAGWGQVCVRAAPAPHQHVLSAASVPYSGPGPLPAAHCWGVVLKGTWCPGFAPAGAELA